MNVVGMSIATQEVCVIIVRPVTTQALRGLQVVCGGLHIHIQCPVPLVCTPGLQGVGCDRNTCTGREVNLNYNTNIQSLQQKNQLNTWFEYPLYYDVAIRYLEKARARIKVLSNTDHMTPIPFCHFAIVLTSWYRQCPHLCCEYLRNAIMTSWNTCIPAKLGWRSIKLCEVGFKQLVKQRYSITTMLHVTAEPCGRPVASSMYFY